jgi:hypothetical protein
MIDKGDIPSIQCKMSLGGPKSMRKVDGLSLIFIDFYVPALYRQSLRLGAKPLETQVQILFSSIKHLRS